MPVASVALPPRAQLLPRLHAAHDRDGFLSRESVGGVARELQLPVAEAWAAATSYPEFHFDAPPAGKPVCTGLACALNGAAVGAGERAVGCQFRCFDAPAPGEDAGFLPEAVRVAGPVVAPADNDRAGLAAARSGDTAAALATLEAANLRGRGGAFFPVHLKWKSALDQGRPMALVVNAEEGEPGIYKDRAVLGLRSNRFLEGLAIAAHVLQPTVIAIFINGEARAARAALEAALPEWSGELPVEPVIVPGGGGYVLGEETTLLNALEGRKPVPRLRPPFPTESGLFGMPTVVNNVETLATLPVIFRDGPRAFRAVGDESCPGTRLFSVSGRVANPGVYELPIGITVADVIGRAGGPVSGSCIAALVGGPSGGFLAPEAFDARLLPGPVHPSGAIMGAGGITVLDETSDIRQAVLAMARFNADESCGKCTPCREGAPRLLEALDTRCGDGLDDLLEVVNLASLCGLGQMAPGPVRSAHHFWPELFS